MSGRRPEQAARIVRILGRRGGNGSCPGRHDGFAQHAPAGVLHDLAAEVAHRLQVAVAFRLGVHVAAGRHHQRDVVGLAAAPAQPGQAGEFTRREMRVAERDQVHAGIARTVELAPGCAQRPQIEQLLVAHAAFVKLAEPGFGRDARDVAHGGRAGRGECGAEGAQVVVIGLQRRDALDEGNAPARGQPRGIARHGIEILGGRGGRGDAQPQHGLARRVQVTAGLGRATGQSGQHFEKVGVLHGARAEHAVGIHDRVGLGPGDLLAQPGRPGQVVGRARVADARTHVHIGLGQRVGGLGLVRRHALRAPVAAVHRNGVERGGNREAPA